RYFHVTGVQTCALPISVSKQKNSRTNEGTGQPEHTGQPGCVRNHGAEDLGVCGGRVQGGTQRRLATRNPAVTRLPRNEWCGWHTYCLCRRIWIRSPIHRYPCRVRCTA